MSALCALACVLFPAAVNGAMGTAGIWALVLLVFSTAITGLTQTLQAWCVRVKAFKATSASEVVRSLSSGGIQLSAGVLESGAPGLI